MVTLENERLASKSDDPEQIHRKLISLSLLFEISQSLERSLDLGEVINPLLKLIAEHVGMLRGTITLLDRETGEISIEAAYGLSQSQQQKGKYKLGESHPLGLLRVIHVEIARNRTSTQ